MSRTTLARSLPLLGFLSSACTITSVGAEDAPPRVEADGLIEGHAAFGFRDEDRFFHFDVLNGPGLAEVRLWRLFRLELGALGFGLGIGPFDVALGTLFYEPEVPRMVGEAREAASPAPASGTADDCEICRKARESTTPR